MNSLVALWLKASWRPLLVLVLALVVRLVYNLSCFEHRICHAGDSYYYLTGGKELARLISTSPNLAYFCAHLWQKASVLPGSFQSFSSTHLTDRLLLDGPVFPSYLGCLFLLLGQKAGELALNVNSTFFATANSIVDSLSCLLLYFLTAEAFGAGAGLTAGLLLALYGPSIINTQQCYSEPFAYFLLLAWCLVFTRLVLHQKSFLVPAYLLFGLLTGLVMLSKPAFVMVPWLGLAVFFIARHFTRTLPISPPGLKALAFPLGLALIIVPWLCFTGFVCGKVSLLVNRAPEYNLFIGNHLPSDGWKTWPTPENIPQSMDEARERLAQQFCSETTHSLGLIFRKIPRLFGGVWNEFQYEVVGLNLLSQNLVQGLLLLLGWLGFAALVGRSQREEAPRQFCLALTIAAIAGFHLVYALFEPVPRYAITAIPMVIALGAGGLFTLFRGAARLGHEFFEYSALVVMALIAAIGFYQLYTFYSFIPLLGEFVPSADFLVLRLINCVIWLLFFALLVLMAGMALSLAGLNSRLAKSVLSVGALLMVACCIAFFNFDPAQAEWYHQLVASGDDCLVQTLNLPESLARSRSRHTYILVDCQGDAAPPALAVRINGRDLPHHPWLLWHEIKPSDKDVHALLHFQGNSMSRDFRLMRQWWAFPIASETLVGGDNIIQLRAENLPVKVYGDFLCSENHTKIRASTSDPSKKAKSAGERLCLPSLEKFSWTKGFLSFDHRDPRSYEPVSFAGQVMKSARQCRGRVFDYDLSDSPGLQNGAYRIRIASSQVEESGILEADAKPIIIYNSPAEFTVRGDDPRTMTVTAPVVDGLGLPAGGLLKMSLLARKDRSQVGIPVEVSLSAAASVDGKPLSWTSQWQPSSLKVGSQWSAVEYANFLPADCLKWKQAVFKLLFAPFPADRLYLHPKQAMKDKLYVRDVRIEILPTAPPSGQGRWLYY